MRRLVLLLTVMFLFGCHWPWDNDDPVTPPPAPTDQFSFFGKTGFKKFVSYFGAIEAKDLRGDLAWIKSKGFDGVRIMCNWSWDETGIITGSGGVLNPSKLKKLSNVLQVARKNKLIVDISFITHPDGENMSWESFRKAQIRILRQVYKWGFKEVIWDLANEHHYVTQAQAKQLAKDIKNICGNTYLHGASIACNHSPEHACNVAKIEGQTMVRYHDPRVRGWSSATQGLAQRAQKCFPNRPVYFDEPTATKYGDSCEKTCNDFVRACKGAKKAKIAGWCFHTYAGFCLNRERFKDALDSEEKKFINLIGKI